MLAGPDLHCSEGEPVLACCLGMERNPLADLQLPISIPGNRREMHPASSRNAWSVDDTPAFVGVEASH
jgi:hypothetical protein